LTPNKIGIFTMSNPLNRPRRWGITLGLGSVTAAALIGVAAAADAHADTGSDVLGQAGTDLTDATTLLDGAPTASLDAEETAFLTGQESLQNGPASAILSTQESIQDSLPAADQTELAGVDTQLEDAYQGILTADQTFVTADQAGDLTGLTAFTDDFGVIQADLAVIPADFNAGFADVGADLASLFGGTDFLSLF
jgi:hypothetical protein